MWKCTKVTYIAYRRNQFIPFLYLSLSLSLPLSPSLQFRSLPFPHSSDFKLWRSQDESTSVGLSAAQLLQQETSKVHNKRNVKWTSSVWLESWICWKLTLVPSTSTWVTEEGRTKERRTEDDVQLWHGPSVTEAPVDPEPALALLHRFSQVFLQVGGSLI